MRSAERRVEDCSSSKSRVTMASIWWAQSDDCTVWLSAPVALARAALSPTAGTAPWAK